MEQDNHVRLVRGICNIFISTNVSIYNYCNIVCLDQYPNNTMQIKERREGFLVLLTKGMKGYEIAKELGVDASTVSRDIQYLISQSHNYLNSTLDEPLMFAGPDRVFPYGGYAGSTHFYNTATGPSSFLSRRLCW